MQTVQHTKHFAHPANWAGFLLVGADVRLSNKVALMGQALCELLKTPDRCRDALRVTLHLVSSLCSLILKNSYNILLLVCHDCKMYFKSFICIFKIKF